LESFRQQKGFAIWVWAAVHFHLTGYQSVNIKQAVSAMRQPLFGDSYQTPFGLTTFFYIDPARVGKVKLLQGPYSFIILLFPIISIPFYFYGIFLGQQN